jgi:hypothetical protein
MNRTFRENAGALRRVLSRFYRRSRTAGALPLKCAEVNVNSKTSDLANHQTLAIVFI